MSEADRSVASAEDLTRGQLFERVWAEPMQHLAARYGLSDVGLKKLCRRENIPTPPRGYWARVEAGQRVARPRLPAGDGRADRIVLEKRIAAASPVVEVPAQVRERSITESAPEHRIVVAASLADIPRLSPLVRQTRTAHMKSERFDGSLRVRIGEGLLNLRVSEGVLDRALCIYDALIKALEQRGFPVRVGKPRPTYRPHSYGNYDPYEKYRMATVIEVGDQDVLLEMREFTRKAMVAPTPVVQTSGRRHRGASPVPMYTEPPRLELVPAGRLHLSIPKHIGGWSASYVWTDTASRRLEDVLNDVVVAVVASAEENRDVIAKWRRDEEERRLAAEREVQRRRQLEREAQLARELERQVAAWRLAGEIRAYLEAAKAAGAIQTPQEMTGPEWIAWATAHAEKLDPVPAHVDGPSPHSNQAESTPTES
jgi:hypothetical protein